MDFALKSGTEITELIQVTYESSNPDVVQREIKALIEAGKELNVKNLLVLTWDEKRDMEKDGMTIQFRPLWEWLLEKTEA